MFFRKKYEKVVLDTSAVIQGVLSFHRPKIGEVVVHEAVLSELENQANKGRDQGFKGLAELKKLKDLYKVRFSGKRPNEFEIKYAKSGEIDSIIRDLALEEKAFLVTGDKVQASIAELKGVKTLFYTVPDVLLGIKKFFKKDKRLFFKKDGVFSLNNGSLKKVSNEDFYYLLKDVVNSKYYSFFDNYRVSFISGFGFLVEDLSINDVSGYNLSDLTRVKRARSLFLKGDSEFFMHSLLDYHRSKGRFVCLVENFSSQEHFPSLSVKDVVSLKPYLVGVSSSEEDVIFLLNRGFAVVSSVGDKSLFDYVLDLESKKLYKN